MKANLLKWGLAFVSPVFALGGAALLYWQHGRLGPKYRIPAPAYALVIAVAAVVGYFVGVFNGIDLACSPPAGNLCGLEGFFVIGPLTSSFAIFLIGALILFFAA
jgi:hypothetical protein